MNGALQITTMVSAAVMLTTVLRARVIRSAALCSLLAVGLFVSCDGVGHAQSKGLLAHDINGFTLDMTVAQVEAAANKPLNALDGGRYQVDLDGIDYIFGFTALKHLYRIDSKQQLGSFVPNKDFAEILTGRLEKKFGAPQSNLLPSGPALWRFTEVYADGKGQSANRETESLFVLLGGGNGEPVSVEMQLTDLRILRRDERSTAATK